MSRLLPRLMRKRSPLRRQAGGFALPIALGASMLVLLSGGSLQLLALRDRVEHGQQLQRHQIEDALASAAQQQAAALDAAQGCLLAIELPDWQQSAAACGMSPELLQTLLRGRVFGLDYQVTAYRVVALGSQTGTAELELQLAGERPWRALYRLSLLPRTAGWQIAALQELGLRGAGA